MLKFMQLKIPGGNGSLTSPPFDYSDLLIEELLTLKNYGTSNINANFSICCSNITKRWAI